MNVNTNNLSPQEGDTIKNVVGKIVDIIVVLTGGKPSFGNKK